MIELGDCGGKVDAHEASREENVRICRKITSEDYLPGSVG